MSKAEQIVSRMLEAGPDDVDPKGALMDTEPEMRMWLVRNGFLFDAESGSFQRDIGDAMCDVFPPTLWDDTHPQWIVNFDDEVRSHVGLSASAVRSLLIQRGWAT
jgi:hypothetical protein